MVINFRNNAGDNMGHVIYTVLPGCNRSTEFKKGIKSAHFNLKDRSMDHPSWNCITDSLTRMMKIWGAGINPDY